MKNPDKALRHYKQKAMEMKFPPHLKLPYAIHDFPEIEKSVWIDLWLYKPTKDGNSKDDIKLERQGANPNVDKEHVVYLFTIYESDHVVLIKDIDDFLKPERHGHHSNEDLPN